MVNSAPPPSRLPAAIGRRAFLRQATAAMACAALPQIVRPGVLGAEGTAAPSERITIGFIGTGRQCYYANIPGFLREADAQVVAVCDVDAWRMAAAKRQVEEHYGKQRRAGSFQGCAEIRDWRELISRAN